MIRRGRRSMGYGFVAFQDEASVKKAIETMNKTVFHDREINVETAVKRTERPAPKARKAREPREGPLSQTSVFVANLPFKVEDQDLLEMFQQFSPVSARVVKRKNGFSKGFGFVEFPSSAHQASAIQDMDGAECEGRKLSVKVAVEQVEASQ